MSSSSKLLHYLLLSIFILSLAQPKNVTTTTTTPSATTTTTAPANATTAPASTTTTTPSATTTTTPTTTTTTAPATATTPPATTTSAPVTTTATATIPVTATVKHVSIVHHKFNGEVQPYEICLDGANNSFVSYDPKVGDFGLRNFTVAIWIQTTETLPLFDVVGNRNDSGQGNYFQMRMTGTNPTMLPGQVIVELDQNATAFNYVNLTSNRTGLNDGNWHYLVFVRDGLNLTLYVDGVMDNTVLAPGIANITNPVDFKVGRSVEAIAGPVFAPVACYAELRVYRRALSATHIGKLFAVQGTVY